MIKLRKELILKFLRTRVSLLILLGMNLLLFCVYLAPSIFVSIHSGKAGVLWHRLNGTEVEKIYQEGLTVIFPWDVMYIYDVRQQEAEETYDVLSSDGLKMEAHVSVRFRPVIENLGVLHKHVGPDYVQTLLLPQVGSRVREVISKYPSQGFYSEERRAIQDAILVRLQEEFLAERDPQAARANLVRLEDVLIRSISLPPKIEQAIKNKLVNKHMAEEYEYRLIQETREKERKRIEAEGIKAFQNIVSNGISEKFLLWKGIDATLEMARSDNSKIVIIGAGNSGLPVILGGLGDVPQGSVAPPQPRTDTAAMDDEEEPPTQVIDTEDKTLTSTFTKLFGGRPDKSH